MCFDLCRHFGELGSYLPSFFFIKINVNIKFQDNFVEGPLEYMAVFLHEYIHYLQDISTTYGYLEIHKGLEYLIGYLHYAQNNDNRLLLRTTLKDNNADKLKEFMSCTQGDTEEYTYDAYDSIKIDSVFPSNTLNFIDDLSTSAEEREFWKACTVPCLNLYLRSGHKTRKKNFNFGARAVSESMARLIERRVYQKPNNLYMQIQYDVAKLLFEYVMNENISDAFVVELCDISLMDCNPGAYYYNALLAMKYSNFKPQKIGDIYEFTQKYSSDYRNIFDTNYCYAIQSINGVLGGSDETFGNLRMYTTTALKKGKYYRDHFFNFIQKMMGMTSLQILRYWNEIAHKLYMPLVVTKNHEIYGGMSNAGEAFNEMFFIAYYTMKNILSNEEKEPHCDLLDICRNLHSACVDNNCINMPDPWNKIKQGNMCPLAVLWKMWKLEDKSILYE